MILSLMLLMAMQQQVQSPCDVQTCTFATTDERFTEIVIAGNKEYCDKPITFGKTKKKIADMFPEECGGSIPGPLPVVTNSWQSLEPNLPKIEHLPEGAGRTCGEFSCDEPAIQEERIIPEDERPSCKPMTCPTAKSCFVNAICLPPDEKETVWTCADKSRILLTAEDGKQWCYAPHQ